MFEKHVIKWARSGFGIIFGNIFSNLFTINDYIKCFSNILYNHDSKKMNKNVREAFDVVINRKEIAKNVSKNYVVNILWLNLAIFNMFQSVIKWARSGFGIIFGNIFRFKVHLVSEHIYCYIIMTVKK
jgi:hypothetical protein